MTSLVTVFQPFSISQSISVYSDGDIIESFDVPMDKVVDTIAGLKNQYNVEEINLIGSQDYLLKFKANLNSKFNNDAASINIISR